MLEVRVADLLDVLETMQRDLVEAALQAPRGLVEHRHSHGLDLLGGGAPWAGELARPGVGGDAPFPIVGEIAHDRVDPGEVGALFAVVAGLEAQEHVEEGLAAETGGAKLRCRLVGQIVDNEVI